MRYLFEVLGENEALGKAEVFGVVDSYREEYEILGDDDGILVLETTVPSKLFERRLGLTRVINQHLISGDFNTIKQFFEDYTLGVKTFCVRTRRLKNFQPSVSKRELEQTIGGILSKQTKVDLENPETEIRIIISNSCYAGLKTADVDRTSFEDRKVRYRPFFSPISLHPKLARALVNLSRIKEGRSLLDPFCGTGGILMEAGLVGADLIGSDISERMVKGCKDNLRAFGLRGKIFRADISETPDMINNVDAIATDPPYGRASSTKGEDIASLYERMFESFNRVLKKGSYIAIILPDREHVELGSRIFEQKEIHEVRVHGSLSRFFTVFKK